MITRAIWLGFGLTGFATMGVWGSRAQEIAVLGLTGNRAVGFWGSRAPVIWVSGSQYVLKTCNQNYSF